MLAIRQYGNEPKNHQLEEMENDSSSRSICEKARHGSDDGGCREAYTDGDNTRTNMLINGDFGSSATWVLGTGWTIGSGVISHAAGTTSSATQPISPVAGQYYRISCLLTLSAGSFRTRLSGGTNTDGALRSAGGSYLDRLQAVTGNNTFVLSAAAGFVGTVDNVICYQETAACAPQGVWDYYAVPFNGSNIAGTPSGPVTVTIV